MSGLDVDLGGGYWLRWADWSPDRDLNPQYDGIPDVEKISAIIGCPHGHQGAIHVRHSGVTEDHVRIFGDPWWDLVEWEPLHIEPSVQFLSPACCHGFIRGGKWVPA